MVGWFSPKYQCGSMGAAAAGLVILVGWSDHRGNYTESSRIMYTSYPV